MQIRNLVGVGKANADCRFHDLKRSAVAPFRFAEEYTYSPWNDMPVKNVRRARLAKLVRC